MTSLGAAGAVAEILRRRLELAFQQAGYPAEIGIDKTYQREQPRTSFVAVHQSGAGPSRLWILQAIG